MKLFFSFLICTFISFNIALARPSLVSKINYVFVCKGKKALDLEASAFCAHFNFLGNTLFIDTTPSKELALDFEYFDIENARSGSLNTWCNKQVADGNLNPQCSVYLKNRTGQIFVLNENLVFHTIDRISVNLPSSLPLGEYIVTIVENGSGSNAFTHSEKLLLK